MEDRGIVFGLLDTSRRIGDANVASRFREFTISWSRYGYQGTFIESQEVNSILDNALEQGYRHCLIQAYGHVICENWYPAHWHRGNFHDAIKALISTGGFLAAGHVVDAGNGWYGLADRCLLVDLKVYRELGRPQYDRSVVSPVRLPGVEHREGPLGERWLHLSGELECVLPSAPGWNFIAESLRNGIGICEFGESIRNNALNLYSEDSSNREAIAVCLCNGTVRGRESLHEAAARRKSALAEICATERIEPDQRRFFGGVARQIDNVKRGVFLWNVESYSDIESPPSEFASPVAVLYSVASGFKPNRILQRFGFDNDTRVVFFDYSPKALQIKRLMVEEWDGEDYPDFLRYVFRRFPSPETFYHLWADLTTAELDPRDVDTYWQTELERWGGKAAFKSKWEEYRKLGHEYIECDILSEPEKLVAEVGREPSSVIWWSNAFFTVYGNWLYSSHERKGLYESWIGALAAMNPDLYLYGADYNNSSVNCIKALSYLQRYQEAESGELTPAKLHRYEIAF